MTDERIEQWGLSDLSDAEIESAASEYQRAFYVDPRESAPSIAGHRILRGTLAKVGREAWLEQPNERYRFADIQPRALLWTRPLLRSEDDCRRIVAIDKRASYLHACDARLGLYGARKLTAKECKGISSANWLELKRGAGAWKLRITGASEATFLPLTLMGRPSSWYYSSIVRGLCQLGYEFAVDEAFEFSESREVMSGFRDKLLPIVKGEQSILRTMVKRTYVQGIGLLGSRKYGESGTAALYRPDWRGEIVDQAAARMLHNTVKVERLTGRIPCAIYDDALYYPVSDVGSFLTAVMADKNLCSMFAFKGEYQITAESASLLCQTPAIFARDIKQWEVVNA